MKQLKLLVKYLSINVTLVAIILLLLSPNVSSAKQPMKGQSVNITGYTPFLQHQPKIDGKANHWCEWGHAGRYPDWFRDGLYFNAGFFYHEHLEGWQAISSSSNTMTYPGLTYFVAHDIEGGRAPSPFYIFREKNDCADWNVMEFDFQGVNVKCWILGNGNCTDDSQWINHTDGLQNSCLIGEGGLTLPDMLDDRGFIVRIHNDPNTDKHWFPGMAEPGDPTFNWATWYGAFGYYGFNSSFWDKGIDQRAPSYHDEDENEVYEWAFHMGNAANPVLIPPPAPNPGPPGPGPFILDSLEIKIVVIDPKYTIVYIAPNRWIHFHKPIPPVPWPPIGWPPGIGVEAGPNIETEGPGNPISGYFLVRNIDPRNFEETEHHEDPPLPHDPPIPAVTMDVSVTGPPGWWFSYNPTVTVGPQDGDVTNEREWQILEVGINPSDWASPAPVTMTLTDPSGEHATVSSTLMVLPMGPAFNPLVAPPNMELWLDPHSLGYLADGDEVESWEDRSTAWVAEDAEMTEEPLRRPVYLEHGFPNGQPGVLFQHEYGESMYGFSDILVSPYNLEITSGNPDKWNPTSGDKSLFVVFQPGVSGGEPYYSDGRQTILEVGGPLSGFNLYIAEGKICFGMWNRFESKFTIYDPPSDFYPLDPGFVYMAHLEYDSDNDNFRVFISSSGVPGAVSPPYEFHGLSKDYNDKTGIGGAARTRYHDYSIGSTYSDHFGGLLGDVMLCDDGFGPGSDPFDPPPAAYLNEKYGPFEPFLKASGDWVLIETSKIKDNALLSDAWPNPFTEKTSFSVYLPEKQRIKVEVFDSYANRIAVIHDGMLSKGIHDFTIDGSSLISGMYMFRVTGDNFVESGKVILNK